jgi:Xaa-Pro aminopeptidase
MDEKLARLRERMAAHGYAAYIVPGTDPHQSEYIAERWQARSWLSGFSGSAGTVVVTQDRAGLWTDSRYYLEAEQVLRDSEIELFKSGEPDVPDYPQWLADTLPEGARVSFDTWLFPVSAVRNLRKTLERRGLAVDPGEDLIERIWPDRPDLPQGDAFLLGSGVTGATTREKLDVVRTRMRQLGADTHLITTLDDIAWLFNVRGSDVPYNPVLISYACITEEEAHLFLDAGKLGAEDRHLLNEDGVSLHSYDAITGFLNTLSAERKVLIDSERVSFALYQAFPEHVRVIEERAPSTDLKAVKNGTELDGMRRAMIKDGVALVRFLYWLEQQAGGEQTEVTAAQQLAGFRGEQAEFRGESFPAIVGFRDHGAVVHYEATPESAYTLEGDGLLLVDSGGHYAHGTTDITRVIPFGGPDHQAIRDFTLVLKAHVALARAVFPQGTDGHQLDTIPRTQLWDHGLNYGHGTGHGVGFYLNVHEGPQRISAAPSSVALEPGMVLSNEPGLYRAGRHGIRIENLVAVREHTENAFGRFYGFETLSLCPIDHRLIDASMLSDDERSWLNEYHERVYKSLAPHLDAEHRSWLDERTQPL